LISAAILSAKPVIGVARMAVRADDVEEAVGERDRLAVELERLAVMPVVDQRDRVPGDQLAVLENDDLGRLHLIVDDEAQPRKSGRGRARHAADVLGLAAVLADQLVLDRPRRDLPGRGLLLRKRRATERK
jgi:hypothetical protein